MRPSLRPPLRPTPLLLALLVATPLAAQNGHRHDAASGAGDDVIDGLGDWHHPIATTEPRAQALFDQGLRLAYGFNHEEALRSFRAATAADPACTMCWWGVAYVLGPNINAPMEREAEALEATRAALRTLGPDTRPVERAWVEALARRYAEPVGEARAARDSAWAEAVGAIARAAPDDVDAQVIHAEALLLLRPWNQWTRLGEPQPGTLATVDILEGVLARQPDHAGACHFYIHTVEAGPEPERALECARRLPELMPAAGHVVHMPAHVYLRTGLYVEAAEQNEAAVDADHGFLDGRPRDELYPLFYAPHNLHFLWFSRMMAGQEAQALRAADTLRLAVSAESAAEIPSLQAFRSAHTLTLVRFHRWDRILAEPVPGEDRLYERGLAHYARGWAHAAKGDVEAAGAELAALDRIRAGASEDMIIILNPAPLVFEVARHVLDGVVRRAAGDADGAIAAFTRAVEAEERLTYDEPPAWYQGARQLLGSALLEAGRPAEAEVAFRQDLLDLPRNGWALAGLVEALERQGRTREANVYRVQLRDAWRAADAPTPRVLPGDGSDPR